MSGLAGVAEPPPLLIAELGDLTLASGEILRGAKLAYRQLGKFTGCELDQFKEIIGSFPQ